MFDLLLSCFRPRPTLEPVPPPAPKPWPPIAVGPPAGLRLPPELILKSVEFVALHDDTKASFQAALDGLSSLCLVSRWFYQVTFPLLYQRVMLPSEARIGRFIKTTGLGGWEAKRQDCGVGGEMTAVWLERELSHGGGRSYRYNEHKESITKVFGALIHQQIITLTIDHFTLPLTSLSQLSGLKTMSLTRVQIMNDFDEVLPALCLPELHTLRLANVDFDKLSADFWGDGRGNAGCLLRHEVLPKLASLAVVRTEPVMMRAANDFEPGFVALLGQLKSVTVDGFTEWILSDMDRFFGALTRVEGLATSLPDEFVQRFLRHVTAPLKTLDLSGPLWPDVFPHRPPAQFEWSAGWASVGKLECVVLPAKERWLDDPEAAKPASWLGQVEAAARAQGAKVEFR